MSLVNRFGLQVPLTHRQIAGLAYATKTMKFTEITGLL
jgi:hypothetical protein